MRTKSVILLYVLTAAVACNTSSGPGRPAAGDDLSAWNGAWYERQGASSKECKMAIQPDQNGIISAPFTSGSRSELSGRFTGEGNTILFTSDSVEITFMIQPDSSLVIASGSENLQGVVMERHRR